MTDQLPFLAAAPPSRATPALAMLPGWDAWGNEVGKF